MENSMEVQTKTRTAIWSSNPTPGQISKQNYNSKRYNSQDMEATEMSIDKRMDKEDVVHMYNGILLSHKKEWNNAIGSNIDTTRGYHTKWSKSERERQIPYDITYVESKIWHNYLWNRNRFTEIENRHVVAKGVGGEMDLEFGTSRCKRLHVEWKTNKVLLYSTGSYIQYPGINHNGKENEKEYIYICVCVYNWVILLYSRNEHIVNPLSFNKI